MEGRENLRFRPSEICYREANILLVIPPSPRPRPFNSMSPNHFMSSDYSNVDMFSKLVRSMDMMNKRVHV